MADTTAPAARTITDVTDLNPGDRVRCYDIWNGTVVRVVTNFLGGFAIVDYDYDQGQTVVYAPYIQTH